MSKESIKVLKNESPVGKVFDFADFLSPMLVKELRQGLRSIGFSLLFIIMQIVLALALLMILVLDGPGAIASYTIFLAYFVAVCGIQPLRGANAVSAEIKGDTIDLVSITSLSSWKIVSGKWVSLMAQSLLFGVSLLPYVILRYFLGDMQLFGELVLFAIIFITGGIVTALSVGGSAIPSLVLRFIVVGGVIGFTVVYGFAILSAFFAGGRDFLQMIGSDLQPVLIVIGVGILVGTYLSWVALDYGASMIAPISENRASNRRLVYLCFLALGLAVSVATVIFQDAFVSDAAIISVVSCIMICAATFVIFLFTLFSEYPYVTKGVARKMLKRKIAGKLRFMLYPGWASGWTCVSVCIAMLIGMLACFYMITVGDSNDEKGFGVAALLFTGALASLTFPACLVVLFKRKSSNLLTMYLIFLIASILVSVMVLFLANGVGDFISVIFSWIPLVTVYQALNEMGMRYNNTYNADLISLFTSINLVSILVHSIIIRLCAIPYLRQIKQQEKLAIELMKKENSNPSSNEDTTPDKVI
ncbi:hypothetical protein OAB00_04240 [Akkermansiaceae bacterium]|nr:hypothetical protein [Akkermansiaceae bacterium]